MFDYKTPFKAEVIQKFIGKIADYEVDNEAKFDHLSYIADEMINTFPILNRFNMESKRFIIEALSNLYDKYAIDTFNGDDNICKYEEKLINLLHMEWDRIQSEFDKEYVLQKEFSDIIEEAFFRYESEK